MNRLACQLLPFSLLGHGHTTKTQPTDSADKSKDEREPAPRQGTTCGKHLFRRFARRGIGWQRGGLLRFFSAATPVSRVQTRPCLLADASPSEPQWLSVTLTRPAGSEWSAESQRLAERTTLTGTGSCV